MTNPLNIAAKGKGMSGFLHRFGTIGERYGFSPEKMDLTLEYFADLLNQYGAGATFPITAVTLARNKVNFQRFQAKNIEFAIHGFYHTDYSQLPDETQAEQIQNSIQLFKELDIACSGFRSPYLRWNDATLNAITEGALLYDSSQGLAWNLDDEIYSPEYRHVLKFYRSEFASVFPSLPKIDNGLVRLPYCLPDDEALVERLSFETADEMSSIWLSILHETHRSGEMFTLGLHPERIFLCERPLRETLEKAIDLRPAIWISRLDEIAQWWKTRNKTIVDIKQGEDNVFEFIADGPDGLVFFARGGELLSTAKRKDHDYQIIEGNSVKVRCATKPVLGVSESSDPQLTSFLKQQGYICETVDNEQATSIYLDYPVFNREDERTLLDRLESSSQPLIKFGRWPNGARSALCVTGDIDALTVWDYGLRIFGN